MARLNIRAAQAKALAGETDAAEDAFADIVKRGKPYAAVALAEIAAFRGDWPAAFAHVETAFGAFADVRTGNVERSLILLAVRAARETGRVPELGRIAALASPGARGSLPALLEKLTELASNPDHEFVMPKPLRLGGRAKFDKAIAEMDGRPFASEEARGDEVYVTAELYDEYDGAVELFSKGEPLPGRFPNALFLAKALAKAKRDDDAWGVIEARIERFWPAEVVDIAPTELVVDRDLARVMTSPRCEMVLATPRGPSFNR